MGKSGQKNAAAARTPEKRLRAIGGQGVSSGRKGPHRDAKPYRRSSAAGSVRKRPSPASRFPCRRRLAQARDSRPAARSRPHPTKRTAPARAGRNTRSEAGQRPKKGRSLSPKTLRQPHAHKTGGGFLRRNPVCTRFRPCSLHRTARIRQARPRICTKLSRIHTFFHASLPPRNKKTRNRREKNLAN